MKNYVIIGGSSGIGLEIVRMLSVDNKVFAFSRSMGGLSDLANVSHHNYDVTSDEKFDFQIPDIIDGFVYTPGSITLKPFTRLTESDFLSEYKLNVLGAIKTIHALLPHLKKSSSASIVFFSTVAVQIGMPFHASIASSKGALEALAKSLAAELAPAIRVNVLAPSLTNTPLAEKLLNTPEKTEALNKRHPLGRIGTAGDIAEATCFLLSEKSAWITGQIIHIDGGLSTLRIN